MLGDFNSGIAFISNPNLNVLFKREMSIFNSSFLSF